MLSDRISHCVEALCQKGCRSVWRDMAVLERGDSLPETLELNGQEIRLVLQELHTIMAVYEGKCSPDGNP